MSVQVKGSGTIGGLDEGLNIVGVVTATSFNGAFTGDVTGTASQVTIAGGADNRLLTAASANTLNGEATLTYDGQYLVQNVTNGKIISGNDNLSTINSQVLHLRHSNLNSQYVRNETTKTDHSYLALSLKAPNNDFQIWNQGSGGGGYGGTNSINFYQAGSSYGPFGFYFGTTQALRINTNGNIVMGNSTTSTTRLDIRFTDTTTYSATSNTPNGLKIFNDSATDNGFAGIELAATDSDDYYGSTLLTSIATGTNYSNDFAIQTRHGGAYAERLRITSDGQVLIGATSYAGGGNNPALYIRTASANAVKIHKTGSGQSSLQLTCDSGNDPDEGNNTGFQLTQEGSSSYIQNHDDGNMYVLMEGTNTILHRANGTIRARASMGGANTATYNESVAWNSFSCNSSNGYDFKVINQNSSPAYTYSLELAAAANVNNTNYRHINCTKNSNSAGIFVVYGNGNVANANNSYGSTSDVKLKENIVDANSQWDDVKQLRVRNFNFIADSNKTKLLGLVAQEAETVCPSLVQNIKDLEEDENGNKTETGTVTKELKYSVLYMKAIKALQEAQTRIETLESKVAALEGS